MHDIADFERRGIPGVFVASEVFTDAATTQGEAIGFQPNRIFVEHPIQDRTDAEMRVIATDVVDRLIASLLSAGGTT